MRLAGVRRATPWIIGLLAVAALLLGGLSVIAVAVGAVLVAALLGHGVRRGRRVAASNGARVAIAGAALSWVLVAIVAIAIATSHGHRGNTGLALALAPLLDRDVHTWAALLELLVATAAVSSGFAIRALATPVRLGRAPSAGALQSARAILAEHGSDSLAPFTVRPDKSLAFAGGGYAAYRVIGDTVVVSADPVGPAGSAAVVLDELAHGAHEAGLHLALYGAGEAHLDAYRALGLRALCVGEEAVVDPRRFSLEGRPVRKLRQSVNRIERRGWEVTALRGRDVDTHLEVEIDAVEQEWRSGHERMLGFAMSLGEFEPGVHSDDLYLLARSPDGELQAVMRFIDHHGNLSLDTMRRVGETPNGLNEALICRALAYARETGVGEVSLNYAGFAHLIRRAPCGGRVRRALTAAFLRVLSGHFQMDRLVLFNEKFSPEWRPRYLVYDSRLALPRVGLRVLQAEGYLPEPRRSRRRARRQARADAARAAVQRWDS